MRNLLKKTKLRAIVPLVLFCMLFADLNAQSGFVVSGNIVDEAGVPLPGATILEQGTNNGAVSDFDGKFSLEVSISNATLIISYIGFEEQKISLNGNDKINIALLSTASTLDEVVLVGYGAVKKKDLTG